MNPVEREKLLEHESTFVETVQNFDELFNTLVKKNVITDAIRDYILQAEQKMQKKELFSALMKRGPNAYLNFISCLRETNNDCIADLFVNCKPEDHTGTIKRGNYKMDYNHEKCYRMRSQPKGFALLINIYEFKDNKHESRSGSDKDLNDLDKLFAGLGYTVFSEFNLTAKGILERVQKFSKMDELFYVDSCIVFIMSHGKSDKDLRGVSIIGSDNETVHSTKIMDCLTASKCPGLFDKPKILFFQACRGYMREYGVHSDKKQTQKLMERFNISKKDKSSDSRDSVAIDSVCHVPVEEECNEIPTEANGSLEDSMPHLLISEEASNHNGVNSAIVPQELEKMDDNNVLDVNPFRSGSFGGNERSTNNDIDSVYNNGVYIGNASDILVVYSCHPGYCSLRDINLGSWLVQDLCKIFSSGAWIYDLKELLEQVMRNADKRYSNDYGYQLMHYEIFHFKKKLYFNPGLYH